MSNGLKILAFGVIGFLGLKTLGSKAQDNAPAPDPEPTKEPEKTPAPQPTVLVINKATDAFPLKQGSRGMAVISLQQMMLEYAKLKNLSIAKTDPMVLNAEGKPDGVFGSQTQRWTIAIMSTSVVNLTAYNWLYNQLTALKSKLPEVKNNTGLQVGDLVYSKGKRTVTRYRAPIEIKKNGAWMIPTFEQFKTFISSGKVVNAFDTVEFSSGEVIGRIASISGNKIRVVVTDETDHHNWWVNPMATHKDYFIFTSDQVFK
jgi:mRNA-degrading endonuclease HigB of HigAB toxin-antitoxin module